MLAQEEHLQGAGRTVSIELHSLEYIASQQKATFHIIHIPCGTSDIVECKDLSAVICCDNIWSMCCVGALCQEAMHSIV